MLCPIFVFETEIMGSVAILSMAKNAVKLSKFHSSSIFNAERIQPFNSSSAFAIPQNAYVKATLKISEDPIIYNDNLATVKKNNTAFQFSGMERCLLWPLQTPKGFSFDLTRFLEVTACKWTCAAI